MAQRKLHDRYFKQAKREGYLARSAYKLAEIDDKYRLLRRGLRVLDLGCSPGSWLQVASERVGEKGVVVGIDLKPVAENLGLNVRTVVGDIYEVGAEDLLALAGLGGETGNKFDLIVSDMAPDTTGHGDHFRSVRLCERVLEIAFDALTPRGDLAMKVFEGEEYPDLLARCARQFEKAKGFKPAASRDISREIYIVGKGFRQPARRPG